MNSDRWITYATSLFQGILLVKNYAEDSLNMFLVLKRVQCDINI